MVKGVLAEWGTCSRTVILGSELLSLTCWKDTVAAGLWSGEIIILDGTTGTQKAILSGHSDWVRSLSFSPDGTSLVSGGGDMTIKLWDVQTGGIVKTFRDHTDWVLSVSISKDSTTIASGSYDNTIRLWDIQTGERYCIIKYQDSVEYVRFSPIHSQHLISVSDGKVWQLDISHHQINPSYDGSCVSFSSDGSYIALSSDGTQLVLCHQADVVIHNSASGAVMAKFCLANSTGHWCCFSPNGGLVAVAANDDSVYIWDITGSDPHLVETLVGHSRRITSLMFSSPSSLITSSLDRSVKFWQVDSLSTYPVVGYPTTTPFAPAPINSITLQAKEGVFVTSDSDGMVRTWNISTGVCKKPLQTPARNTLHSDAQFINSKLILVWYKDKKIHIWDVEKEKLLHEIDILRSAIGGIRISGDGSKGFYRNYGLIKAWSISTGEFMGGVEAGNSYPRASLVVNGSRVWMYSPYNPVAKGGPPGWDFGIPDSPPVKLPNTSSLHLSDTKLWDSGLSSIKDTITGKVILQLGGRFAELFDVQLGGQYLLARYWSGEILILDFNDVPLW